MTNLNMIYRYRTELHAHTSPVSSCSDILPCELVETYKELNFDGVVITNHFTSAALDFGSADRFMEYYLKDFYEAKRRGDELGINVILGTELRFSECFNDYLIYGIDEQYLVDCYDYIERGLEAFYGQMKREDNIILQAHPFRNSMEPVRPQLLDGIETYNVHPEHNSRVAVAAKYAAEHNLIATAGSDFHHRGCAGLAALRSKQALKTSRDVALCLLSRDYVLEVGGNLILP